MVVESRRTKCALKYVIFSEAKEQKKLLARSECTRVLALCP